MDFAPAIRFLVAMRHNRAWTVNRVELASWAGERLNMDAQVGCWLSLTTHSRTAHSPVQLSSSLGENHDLQRPLLVEFEY
jgi:hypothetical protein